MRTLPPPPPPHTHTHFPKTLQKLVSVREREDKIETARKGIKGCRVRESAVGGVLVYPTEPWSRSFL